MVSFCGLSVSARPRLRRRKRDLLETGFATQHQQRPVPQEGAMFKRAKFKVVTQAELAELGKRLRRGARVGFRGYSRDAGEKSRLHGRRQGPALQEDGPYRRPGHRARSLRASRGRYHTAGHHAT